MRRGGKSAWCYIPKAVFKGLTKTKKQNWGPPFTLREPLYFPPFGCWEDSCVRRDRSPSSDVRAANQLQETKPPVLGCCLQEGSKSVLNESTVNPTMSCLTTRKGVLICQGWHNTMPQTGGLHNRDLFSSRPRAKLCHSWFLLRAWGEDVFQTSGLVIVILSLCLHVFFTSSLSLCPNLLYGHQSRLRPCWWSHFNLITSWKLLSPTTVTFLASGG